jgi:bifunctional UDP-N-acetylglucosamine pyrophosphorylase/glucosamine-1-phosphate N-acetyltransferase
MERRIGAIVLAAGKGTRMRSTLPKVLHKVYEETMLEMVVSSLRSSGIEKVWVVVSPENQDQISYVLNEDVKYIVQEEQLGTGHAVKICREFVFAEVDSLLVFIGDAPFVTQESIEMLIADHVDTGSSCSLLTSIWKDPPPYGRVVRDDKNIIKYIVEEKDANEDEKRIGEVSSSHYIFDTAQLFDNLEKINNNNAQNEYYLPDVVGMLINNNKIVSAIPVKNKWETYGINTPEELEQLKLIFEGDIS